MDIGSRSREANLTAAGAIVGFTVVLTASFVGVVAFLSRETGGIQGRLPFYVLAAAIAFVVLLWYLDDVGQEGTAVLLAVSGLTAVSFVLITLSMEGTVYAIREPTRVFNPQLIVYFVAAALICTGLGIWALHHWREFTSQTPLDRRSY